MATLLAALGFFVSFSQLAQAADSSVGCSEDQSVQVCVVSAALTRSSMQFGMAGQLNVVVSVTLKVTSVSDFPIDLALAGGGWGAWSLTPQNAEAMVNGGDWNVSGLQVCDNGSQCSYTTLSPHASLLMQVRYQSEVSTAGLPLVEVASTSAFTASLRVSERGVPRLISLSLDGFTFGNALQSARH